MTDQTLDKILNKLDKVEGQVDTIAVKVVEMEGRFDTLATKEELNEKFDLVLSNVDRFVKLHEILDQELSALRNKYSRLEERLEVVERQLQTA